MRIFALILVLLAPLALSEEKKSGPTTTTAPAAPPNFVVIVGEGCGWSGTSVAMDGDHPEACAHETLTPNLKKLQEQGMRASTFYASSPRCTPSRASLFTGVSPAVLKMTYVNEGGSNRRGESEATLNTRLLPPHPSMELPAEAKTVAQWLKPAGYRSAHFGKWHVGRTTPTRLGFDADDGANTNQGPDRNAQPNPEEGISITDRGIAFIEAQVKEKKPFYLHLSHYGGGTEEEVTPESMKVVQALGGREGGREGRGKELALKGVVADVDRQIGRLMAKLEELGIAENTYVMFTTDHGTQGHNSNPPLSGGKGSLLEGGVRVPFLVRGPGIKAGSQTDVRGISWDLVPTVLELAGVKREGKDMIEGGSLVRVWRGEEGASVQRPNAAIVMHFPHYDLDNGGPMTSVYSGSYKLLRRYETGQDSLYDLDKDLREGNDLAAKEPERTKELAGIMEAYLKAVGAQMPTKNEAFDPAKAAPEARRGGRRGQKQE